MDRQDVLKRLLYPKCKSAIEFQFDSLMVNPLLSYITVQDITQLNKIATSLKYSSKPKEKYAMIDSIMTNRGFKKMASGTNRVTYRCLNDYRVVIKIAIDKVGLSDNGNEYMNQQLLKPFVTKCFEVSPCGTVGLFERVVPITSREEFVNISDDIFDLINNLIGKYVLEDIGEKFYMNYGLREGFGPVLLDYPYVFELDGRKLICNVPEPMELKGYCGGEIDYDLGYNNLICRKCGKRYLATELKSEDSKSGKPKIIIEGEDTIMRCVLKRGNEVVSKLNSEAPVATNTIRPKKDFVKLKAQVSVKEEEKEEEFKPTIKTRDDVQLKARLRGTPSSKDIDKEAREKEAKLNQNTEKIKVEFEPMFPEKPADPVSNFSAQLSHVVENVSKNENTNEDSSDTKYTVTIDNQGNIWDYDRGWIIGVTLDKYKVIADTINSKSSTEEGTAPIIINPIDNSPIVKGEKIEINKECVKTSSGEPAYVLLTDTSVQEQKPEFKGNENYKTTDIVSPIENYFSNSTVCKDGEETPGVEETDEEETREIPELIIHPREENEDTETYSDEEYDPEYAVEDNSEEESENKIDLY